MRYTGRNMSKINDKSTKKDLEERIYLKLLDRAVGWRILKAVELR